MYAIYNFQKMKNKKCVYIYAYTHTRKSKEGKGEGHECAINYVKMLTENQSR